MNDDTQHAETKMCSGPCGKTKSIDEFYRDHGSADYHGYHCKTCNNYLVRLHTQRNPFQTMVWASRSSDKRAGRDLTGTDYITIDHISEIHKAQDGQCLYCGVLMLHGEGVNRKTNPDGMTVERIDEQLPHVIGNCCLVCRLCNHMRGDKSHTDMIRYAKELKEGLINYCPGCDMYMLPLLFNRSTDRRSGRQTFCRSCETIRRQEVKQRQACIAIQS